MKIPWRIIIIAVAIAVLLTAGMIAWNNLQSGQAGGGRDDTQDDGEWPTLPPEPTPSPTAVPLPTLPPPPTATAVPTPTPIPLIDLYRDTTPIAAKYMEWITYVETASQRAHAAALLSQREETLSLLIRADQTARFAASLARSELPEITGTLPGYNRAMNPVEMLTVFYGAEADDLAVRHARLVEAATELCGTGHPGECLRMTEQMQTIEEISGRMGGIGQVTDIAALLSGERRYDEGVIQQIENDPIIQSHIRALNENLRSKTEALLEQATGLRKELEQVLNFIIEEDQS